MVKLLHGLTVRSYEIVPPGYIVWLKGTDVLGIHKIDGDKAKFFAQFGLTAEAPRGTNAVGMSMEDYERFAARALQQGDAAVDGGGR